MDNIKLVVLDLAGTTIEDTGQVPEAFITVLSRHGIEITDGELSAVRGASKREALRYFLERQSSDGEADIIARTECLFAEFRQHLATIYAHSGINAIPGSADTFDRLHSLGIKVVLNTGFDKAITELIINKAGWEKNTVDAIICGDDVPKGRPAPYLIFHAMEVTGIVSVHQVANVGDTILDLQAGRNAGVRWNIGVLSGAHTKEQLEKVEHTHLISSVAVLPSLWE